MSEVVRYSENPFIEGMNVPTKGRAVRISKIGGSGDVLVNQHTGEVSGTHVTTYRKVDAEKFVKLFTANIALTFALKSAGIKAMNVVIWTVQHNAISKDQVDLEKFTLELFLKSHVDLDPPIKLSLATFGRGIAELEKANIIAKTLKKGRYFINPNFVFNGDRIAFTTVIERVSGDSHLQQDFLT
jgi:hypothetical protein